MGHSKRQKIEKNDKNESIPPKDEMHDSESYIIKEYSYSTYNVNCRWIDHDNYL